MWLRKISIVLMEKLMVLICFIRDYGVRGPDIAINWRSMSVLTYSAAGTRTVKPNFLIGQWPNELSVFIGHF